MSEHDERRGPVPPTRATAPVDGPAAEAAGAPTTANGSPAEDNSGAGGYAQDAAQSIPGGYTRDNYAQTEEFPSSGNYARGNYAQTEEFPSSGSYAPGNYAQTEEIPFSGSYAPAGANASAGSYSPQGGYGASDGYAASGGYPAGAASAASERIPTSPQVSGARVDKSKRPVTRKSMFLTALVATLIGLACGGGVVGALTGSGIVASGGSSSVSTRSDGTITINSNNEDATTAEAVSAKVLPSVVSIDVYTETSSYYLFGPSGSDGSSKQLSGLGSGVILSEDGYILTNNHVIAGSSDLKVNIDGTDYDAKVVGTDSESDLAVIKIDASGLTPVEVGSSSDLTVGQWVLAAGSPFGLEKSVSTGIVSAMYRSTSMRDQSTGLSIYTNMIQTDAAINPGNSGGGLFDDEGKLIGINTLIESYSGSSSGVGFAIPIDYAIRIADQLKSGQEATHAYLGVSLGTVTSENASQLNTTATSGAYVGSVEKGSAAEAAGLKKGDVITSINGNEIVSASEAIIQVRSCMPGDKVSIEYVRGKGTSTCEATLGETTASSSSGSQDDQESGGGQQMPNGNSGNGGSGHGFNLNDLFGF